MRGSKKERAANRKAFSRMNWKEKIDYIVTYYKLPIFTVFVVIVVAISTLVRYVMKKDVVVYSAYANVAIGETLDEALTQGYLSAQDIDQRKNEILVYRDLYLDDDASVENHEYAYASKLKILGAISARQLDVAIMNDDAMRQMSESGFFLKLDFLAEENPSLYEFLRPYLTANPVILEDNSIDYSLGKTDEYTATTEDQVNAVDITDSAFFQDAGIDGNVYIAIIANTSHLSNSLNYIEYILATGN